MGEAAAAGGDGGSPAGDRGAGRARALSRRRGAPRPAAQHTAAGRRIWPGHTFTVASSISASRADAKQFPAAAEQVCERRAGVGGRGGGGGGGRGGRRARRQEGRVVAAGHALVGAHAAAAAALAAAAAAALRDGPAPPAAAAAAAPLVTRLHSARRRRRSRRPDTISRLHSINGTIQWCKRVPEYYRLAIYLFGRGARPSGTVWRFL